MEARRPQFERHDPDRRACWRSGGTAMGDEMTTLILARYPLGARLAEACRAAGLPVGPRGGFGPGRKAVLLLDLPAFKTLASGSAGRLRFSWEPGDPVVIVVGCFSNFSHMAAISRSGAIGLGETELDLLP